MPINVTIKKVPHPNPIQAVDVFARIILEEILTQEQSESIIVDSQPHIGPLTEPALGTASMK